MIELSIDLPEWFLMVLAVCALIVSCAQIVSTVLDFSLFKYRMKLKDLKNQDDE